MVALEWSRRGYLTVDFCAGEDYIKILLNKGGHVIWHKYMCIIGGVDYSVDYPYVLHNTGVGLRSEVCKSSRRSKQNYAH